MRKNPQRTVRLRIERLALEGFDFDSLQRGAVRRAVEAELATLLAGQTLPARLRAGGSSRQPPGPVLRIEAWSDPADLGRQVARAVYEGMGR